MPAPDWSLLLRTPAFEITAFLLGLVVGSFANVCIHRLPRGESVVSPPSRCPACGARIEARDNLPVLGWLLLRGRCRACRAPISWRYPAVEAANGLLWLALAALHGPRPRTFVEMGLVTRAPGPEPDRPRPPDPARRDHAAGRGARASPRASCRARRCRRCTALVAAAAAGWPSPPWRRPTRRRAASRASGRATGSSPRCSARSWAGRRCCSPCCWRRWRARSWGSSAIALRGRDMRYALPLGTFLGAAGTLVVFVGDFVLAWYRGLFGG